MLIFDFLCRCMPYIPLTFHTIISELADEQGLIHRTYSNNWIHEISNGSVQKIIIGLHFPLNSESSAGLARDKTATSILLSHYGVPVIPHILISLPHRYLEGHFFSVVEEVEKLYGYPLVVKPNTGAEGRKVELVQQRGELRAHIDEIHSTGVAAALAPFIPNAVEYRVVMLDMNALIILKKSPQKGEWRHNLTRGASASLDIPSAVKSRLLAIAQKTMGVMGLRVASVDILMNEKAGYQVLEVNSSISLLHFAKHNEEFYQKAKAVYGLLLRESMNS